MTIERKTRHRTILIGIEFTVNGFHLLRSLDGIKSAQFVSHSLQILTRGWSDSQYCVFHHFDWRRQFSGRVTDTNVAILKRLGNHEIWPNWLGSIASVWAQISLRPIERGLYFLVIFSPPLAISPLFETCPPVFSEFPCPLSSWEVCSNIHRLKINRIKKWVIWKSSWSCKFI
jgi:hypothetical protein